MINQDLNISDLPENEQVQTLFVVAHLVSILADRPIIKPLKCDSFIFETIGMTEEEAKKYLGASWNSKGEDIPLSWIKNAMKIDGMAAKLSDSIVSCIFGISAKGLID